MPATSETTTVNIAGIDEELADLIKQVLSELLQSDLVRSVFAQIIDGLPVGKNLRRDDN